MDGGAKNAPCPFRTEGVENTRYHLWFAIASQQQPHSVQQRFSLSRANPFSPTVISGRPLREVFGYRSLLPCTKRQLSESDSNTYFIPSTRWQYPNKEIPVCQAFSISSALFNVISVIFAPPIIRASSRFLPSMSKGVTEVYVLPCRSSLAISKCVFASAASWGK